MVHQAILHENYEKFRIYTSCFSKWQNQHNFEPAWDRFVFHFYTFFQQILMESSFLKTPNDLIGLETLK